MLSPRFVAKRYMDRDEADDAAKAAEVARGLGVRVPRVWRTIPDVDDDAEYDDGAYCIMDRVEGSTLEEKWSSLGWIATIVLGLQLLLFVRRMRSLVSPAAGSQATGKCRSLYLDDQFRPPLRASPAQIMAFVNFWAGFRSIGHEMQKSPEQHAVCEAPAFPASTTLVFTHHDLAPRNLMVDRRGRLWLIDWDYAGFYPHFFEHAAMQNFVRPGSWGRSAVWRWRLFTWLSVGSYAREARVLGRFLHQFMRFRVARRWNILHNGYDSATEATSEDSCY